MLKLIVIVLWWLFLCLKMLRIQLMCLLRYKLNVMFNVDIDYMDVQWLLLCFKSIYFLLVWLLRYEWMMKFYYCLWMLKTERVWTLTLVSMVCDLYFYNILIFSCMCFCLEPYALPKSKQGIRRYLFKFRVQILTISFSSKRVQRI